MKNLWLLIGLLIGFALPVSAVEALSEEDYDKIQVFLAETAAVSDEEYTLGEIAELQGNDPNLVDRIAGLKVGRSPLPGRNLTVTRSLLLSRLRFHKVDIDKLVFPNNDTVKVYRAALKVPGKDIEEAVLAFPGAVMVVSHDRWFLDRIATHILAYEGDSKVTFFEGNYTEYEADRKKRLGNDAAPKRMKYKRLA